MRSIWFLLVLIGWVSSRASACASCGSGGKSPLFLYPNEVVKFHVGWTQTSAFRNLGYNGERFRAGSTDLKRSLVLAAGYRMAPKFYATATVPVIRNEKGSNDETSMGDPILSWNYFLNLPDFTAPLVPQWQVSGSYKPKVARGIQESRDDQQLDVFGAGYNEFSIGTDIWWGMTALKVGLAHSLTFSQERVIDRIPIQPGWKAQSILTLGHDHPFAGKLIGGIVHDYQDKLRIDQERIKGSDLQNLTRFLTIDFMLSQENMLRLTHTKRGVLGMNKNGFAQESFTMALQHIFI